MKTILVLDKNTLAILGMYQAEGPRQQDSGGIWADPKLTEHVAIENPMKLEFVDIARINGVVVISENAQKKAQYLEQQTVDGLELLAKNAMAKGQKMMVKFVAENIRLGITQAGKTKHVRQVMSEVMAALSTGSLYDAIDEIKAITQDKKDEVFITDARLLAAVNELETYLGLPLSEYL